MRTSSKILAAIALAAVSSFAQAASWTGSISAVKVNFIPNNAGSGYHAIQLSGTGSSCSLPTAGTMVFQISTLGADTEIFNSLYEFLLNAKSASANVTITYTTGGFCDITSWQRN